VQRRSNDERRTAGGIKRGIGYKVQGLRCRGGKGRREKRSRLKADGKKRRAKGIKKESKGIGFKV